MNITAEELDAWKKEIDRQDEFLLKHDWKKSSDGWISPDDKYHSVNDAYCHLIDRLLLKDGWKYITHISETTFGLHEGKINKNKRFQSPYTGKSYCFLEALAIYEERLLESDFPNGFNKFSVAVNSLVLTEEVLHTQYVKIDDKMFMKIKDGPILYEI